VNDDLKLGYYQEYAKKGKSKIKYGDGILANKK
jgi:hypothetical protein